MSILKELTPNNIQNLRRISKNGVLNTKDEFEVITLEYLVEEVLSEFDELEIEQVQAVVPSGSWAMAGNETRH